MLVVLANGAYSNSLVEKLKDSRNVSLVKVVAPIEYFRVKTEKLRICHVLFGCKLQPLQVHVIKA